MNKCRFFVALVAFSGILAGSFAATGVINDKMASNPTEKDNVPGGGVLALNGYYDVQATIYKRDIKGLLWATGVRYTGKTFNVQGFMKDVDGDNNYNGQVVQHIRPNGIVDNVAYCLQPYMHCYLCYIPINARDMIQHITLRPQARINSSNIGSNIRIHGTKTNTNYNSVSNGQVMYVGTGNWQLTDFPTIIW